MDDLLKKFQQRAIAELKMNLDEVAWWKDCVARGIVKAEHAQTYIDMAQNIIRTKQHVLGIPTLPADSGCLCLLCSLHEMSF